MPNVSIAIQPDVLERFSDLNFKPSQAIAEFIDNAIQSYLDHKDNNTFCTPGYKLTVDVDIEWGETANGRTFAKSICIKDNAAGIPKTKYDNAFETGHRPGFNQGLNEYGMGMKVAAFWLCRKWTTKSKYFAENTERTLVQNLDEIIPNRHQSLNYDEVTISKPGSYTIVQLDNLYQKNNFTKAKLGTIREELASIYRTFLRRGEIQINVNKEALVFNSPKLLKAPYYDNPNGNDIEWKIQVSKNLFGKEVSGYIGILDEMSEKHSGLVIIRRGRVIVGESKDHLYHPECIFSASQNSHRYKRLYGELEIKGFSASFNKNGFSNIGELEAMLEMIKSTLKIEGYSLIKQASDLRTTNYDIVWRFGNGESDVVEKYRSNTKLIIPNNPQREGFGFAGWAPMPKSIVTSNVVYVAQWKQNEKPIPPQIAPNTFIVSWDFNNGASIKTEKHVKGSALRVPSNPTKVGHKFIGWSPSLCKTVESDLSFIAMWEKVEVQIQQQVLATRSFVHAGVSVRMDLVKDETCSKLITLDMAKYQSDGVIIGRLNPQRISVKDKGFSNIDTQNILLSLAIGMFEAQMNGEDTCDGLMKYIK